MKKYNLSRETVLAFIDHLKTLGPVYAPHKKGDASFSFDRVTTVKDVVLDYSRTLQSIKKYFLPYKETLLTYSLKENSYDKVDPKIEEKIFLGVHSYDMQSVLRLDYNFTQGLPELNYISRRDGSAFIGVSFEPDEFHFSRSVGIMVEETEGFDLYLNRHDEGYTLHVLTPKGEELISGFKGLTAPLGIPFEHRQFQNKIKYNHNRLPDVFDQSWTASMWEEVSTKCVGCGTCNLVCPTCYCFDVNDDVDLNLEEGKRERSWDGCMLNSFAKVAGGENFREFLAQRQRHRVYRKFKYITELTGEPWCVGCGRCTASCPAGISIVEIVNNLCDEYEKIHLHPGHTGSQFNREGVQL